MAELIHLLGAELANVRKKPKSEILSALTAAKKSRYNATSSGRARRINTRSPAMAV
jgi:hypothetical protein